MYEVLVECHYKGKKERMEFKTLYEVEVYLIDNGFTYDEFDEDVNIFYWTKGHFTYAEVYLVE